MTSLVRGRILLCVPNVGRRPNNTHRLYTLALPYLRSACVRAGWECTLLDAYFDNLTLEETVARITEHVPFDIVGFTLNDDAMLWQADAICGRLPGDPVIIAGGVYASRMVEQVFATSSHVQHVFLGEAEASLESFLSQWPEVTAWPVSMASRGGQQQMVRRGPKTVADSLDAFGDWRYADLPQVLGPDEYSLVTSRGCTARCNYCVIGPHWSRYGLWRGHSARWIRDKFGELQARGATAVNIVDDQFLGSPESIARAYELADLLEADGIRVPFVAMTRAPTVVAQSQVFARLRQVGLQSVFIGLESGNDHVLERMRKDATAAQGRQAVALLAAMDVGVASGTIVFHPWTTLASLDTDLAYFSELLEAHDHFEFYGLNEIDLLNGTPLARHADEDAVRWRAKWQCVDAAAHEVYRSWLKAQAVLLFPLLERVGAERSLEFRRDTCRWMIDALRRLVQARREERLDTAFLELALSVELLALRAGAPEALPTVRRADAEAAGERCFA